MSDILDIKLEFLRYGPPHNQLLSPLTPYMALCGADGPVSVTLPFEHAELLNRLNRLRYEIDGHAIAASQREAELQELGKAIARVLAEVPALVSDLRAARADKSRLINLRLVISAYELGLVPFEVTMAPADTSGSGLPLLLRTVTNMTREIRRGQPLQLDWNRTPKILFVFASPPGFPQVPAQDHLEALRRAIDPWIKITEDDEERIADVRNKVSVLPNATIRQISEACQANDYTHVHILAHGGPMPNSDNRRFGLVLCQEDDVGGHVVVDGSSLAMAVKGLKSSGEAKPSPTVVTLATCDSGNISSVLTPGGSIAHELHVQDIPWVIASQFPLWMRASSIAVENLYSGLLAGEDPRWILHRLRQRLRIVLPDTHDWASIVAYAAIASDLEEQVDRFKSRQTKSKIEVKFQRMDALVSSNGAKKVVRKSEAIDAELTSLCGSIRADLAAWCADVTAKRSPKERAERLGLSAASEKRIAIFYGMIGNREKSLEAYRKSRDFYLATLKSEPVNHWAMTQFLSISAAPTLTDTDAELKALVDKHRRWWVAARQVADWQLSGATSVEERIWAHGTLAELELLGSIYNAGEQAEDKACENIARHCKQVRDLSTDDPFPISSTRRQFERYLLHWQRNGWKKLAQAGINALAPD